MAMVYKCDRCGSVFDDANDACRVIEQAPDFVINKQYDLCPSCRIRFEAFMEGKE